MSANNFCYPKTTTDAEWNVVVQFTDPNANAALKFWQTEWKKQTELPGEVYDTTRGKGGSLMTRRLTQTRRYSVSY